MTALDALPAALIGLSLLDHGFAGYRAAAGRDGRIFKGRFYVRAVRGGIAQGWVVVALLAGLAGAVLLAAAEPGVLYADMQQAGVRLACVVGVYAVVVVTAFLPYFFGGIELRTLATVSVFGPLTLLRPAVVVAAVCVASWEARWPTRAVLVVAGLVHLWSERWLDRWIPRHALGAPHPRRPRR